MAEVPDVDHPARLVHRPGDHVEATGSLAESPRGEVGERQEHSAKNEAQSISASLLRACPPLAGSRRRPRRRRGARTIARRWQVRQGSRAVKDEDRQAGLADGETAATGGGPDRAQVRRRGRARDSGDDYAARTCPRSGTVNLKRWWLQRDSPPFAALCRSAARCTGGPPESSPRTSARRGTRPGPATPPQAPGRPPRLDAQGGRPRRGLRVGRPGLLRPDSGGLGGCQLGGCQLGGCQLGGCQKDGAPRGGSCGVERIPFRVRSGPAPPDVTRS